MLSQCENNIVVQGMASVGKVHSQFKLLWIHNIFRFILIPERLLDQKDTDKQLLLIPTNSVIDIYSFFIVCVFILCENRKLLFFRTVSSLWNNTENN